MEYLGKSPNGLNQLSSSLIGLFVSGSKIADFSSASVSIVGSFSASGVQTNLIVSQSNSPIQILGNVQITGSLNISSSISASLFRGDGGGLFNINASAIGDLNQLKSGSAIANISPNKGLIVNTGVSIDNFLIVSGSATIGSNATIANNLVVGGKITTTELHTTFISSSIIYASGSNKFGDATSDRQEITGSLSVSGSIGVTGDTIPTDNTTNEVLVVNLTTGRVGRRFERLSEAVTKKKIHIH